MGLPPEANQAGTARAEDFEFEALREAHNYRRWLLDAMARHLAGEVLEVGAGIGQFTRMLATLDRVKGLAAVEPDPVYLESLREILPDDRIYSGTIEAVPGSTDWDGIVCVNVLEHIEDDEANLRQFADRLRNRRGTLCLFVPARPEIYAPIDRDFGHFRRYTKPELRRKLREAGFVIERLDYWNLAGYFIWWLNFKILGARQFSPAKMRFNDRLIVPIVSRVEKVLVPPIGQSLFAVARAV